MIIDIRNSADEAEAKKKSFTQQKKSVVSQDQEQEDEEDGDGGDHHCSLKAGVREMSKLLNLQMIKYIDDLFNADKIRNAKGEDLMNEKMYFDELDNFGKAFRKLAAAHTQEQNEKPPKVNY